MKKPQFNAMLLVTALFAVFLLGFFLGRQSGTVQLNVSASQPAQPTALPSAEPVTPPSETGFPININTATLEELSSLPGIGEVLARRIVAYREQYGPFLSTEELMDVSGISEKRYEALKEYVIAGG